MTLALDPYARRLPEWIELARAKGHEVLLTLSTPPIARGQRDAGPMAILSSVDPKENLERLDWALDRAAGFVGVVDIVGNRPAAETDPILAKLGEHGLMLVSGTAVGAETASVPLATGDVVIAPNVPRRELDRRLAQLQDKARRDGQAVGIVVADPALLRHLAAWLASLRNQSIALAPATATIAAKPTGNRPGMNAGRGPGAYRRGVGIMLLNRDGLVFVGRRIDQNEEAWQMPQGGIDQGETPREAAFRELKEEIGTDKAEIVAETAEWLRYDLPGALRRRLWRGRYVGQKQKWFAMRFLGARQRHRPRDAPSRIQCLAMGPASTGSMR